MTHWKFAVIGGLFLLLVGCGGIPKKAQDDYNKAVKRYQNSEFAQATSLLKSAVKAYPEYHDARFLLAESLRREGKFTEARKEYKPLLDLNPKDREILLGLGDCYLKDGMFEDALPYYKRTKQLIDQALEYEEIKKKPIDQSYRASFGLAQCYLGLNDANRALKEFEVAAEFKPNQGEVYYYQGVAYERKGGFYDQAKSMYNKAVSVEGDYVLPYRALGYLYKHLYTDLKNHKKLAIENYEKYIQLSGEKDDTIVAELNELKEVKKPKPVNGSGNNNGGEKKPPVKKVEVKKACPMCGREYKGQIQRCKFDGIPLKEIK